MVTTGWETYHGSAMGSTFGVAATAGRLMGLSSDEIVNAMGIAEMQSPNCMLMGWVQACDVPMIKEGMGWSAATGLMSAYMAQSGITGTLTIFDDADDLSELESLGKGVRDRAPLLQTSSRMPLDSGASAGTSGADG